MGLMQLKWQVQEKETAMLPVKSEQSTAVAVTATNAIATRAESLPAPSQLTADQKHKRDERWLYCKLVTELQSNSKKNRQEACADVAAREAHRFPILCQSGKGGKSQLTYNNCRNWLQMLKGGEKKVNWDNINMLVDNYQSGLQAVKGDEEFWTFLRAFYLNQNKLPISEAYRLACQRIRKQDPFAVVPSISSVRYRLLQIDPTAVALARYGEEYVKNNHLNYIHRDWTDVRVNEIWFTDHRQFDCAIKDWNEEKQQWEAKRPWLCGFMCAKSWKMVGMTIQIDSPNTKTICDTLAHAITEHGRPDYIYSDNGKDFLAQGFATPVEFDGVEHSIVKELGIKIINSLPYNGRAKTIERTFKNHATRFDKYFSSYLGNRPGARPEVASYFWKHPEQLPSLDEFCRAFAAWLQDQHEQPNNGKILGGLSPQQMFDTGERVINAPISRDALQVAFLRPFSSLRKVHRGPAISVNKTEYYGDCLWQYFNQKIMIKMDLFNDEHVFAFEPDGTPIGECKTQKSIKALALTEAERAQISEAMATNSRQLKRAYSIINDQTDGLRLLTPQELLQLPEDFKIVKAGEISSVKGSTHKFRHYIAEAKEQQQLAAPKPNKKKQQLAEFHKQVISKSSDSFEPESSPEELAEFHKLIVANKKRRQTDYDY
ncbi:MAG: transposase family protein [Victivallaceae bacterium]|nr:transposase family protein [Victivallaceae bacterium]